MSAYLLHNYHTFCVVIGFHQTFFWKTVSVTSLHHHNKNIPAATPHITQLLKQSSRCLNLDVFTVSFSYVQGYLVRLQCKKTFQYKTPQNTCIDYACNISKLILLTHHLIQFKVFLHPPEEIPMVRDLGFAVPPGRHSLIAVRSSMVSN